MLSERGVAAYLDAGTQYITLGELGKRERRALESDVWLSFKAVDDLDAVCGREDIEFCAET